ncbi:hypothetical protein [Sphingorhabdus sp. Alg239-R122]|uniref:hypothetical protein n=1 Tax=Sphingorhabdus sp. Alg239-R122 TaxID=2305989 RepID=UPI001F0804B1|nr:hypothetical protein [Sphingorhabdus sp. Alg239-R122]
MDFTERIGSHAIYPEWNLSQLSLPHQLSYLLLAPAKRLAQTIHSLEKYGNSQLAGQKRARRFLAPNTAIHFLSNSLFHHHDPSIHLAPMPAPASFAPVQEQGRPDYLLPSL